MMRWNSFSRSAVFAAVAAAGWLPWVLIVGSVVGSRPARSLYLIGLLAAYVTGLGANRARGVLVAAASGGAALFLLHFASTTTELVLGLAALLAIARSAFLYRAGTARAVVIEAVLQLGGLLLVRWLAGPTLVATTLGVWGYLLVQSCYFLLVDATVSQTAPPQLDAFDRAHRAASQLLERG